MTLRLPGFSAEASLPATRQFSAISVFDPIGPGLVVPAQPTPIQCFADCIRDLGQDWPEAIKICAWECGIELTEEFLKSLLGPGGGEAAGGEAAAGGFLGWPGWGPIAGTAGATLVGIGLGTLLAYEIEQGGWLAPKAPQPGTSTLSCVGVPPNTQHQITESSHLGCARSESLARIAANEDCKTRTSRCTGSCPGGGTCAPYAKVWNTATVQAGGFWEALASGCSTTAFYTCECGC